jgi:hypothetical protein
MKNRRRTKLLAKIFGVIIVALILASYGLYQSRNLRAGPEIIIEKPKNGELVNTSVAEVTGVAKNITFISLNDQPIFVDESGRFSEKLLLSYGYNILKLSAKDKFGKIVEKRLELVYK